MENKDIEKIIKKMDAIIDELDAATTYLRIIMLSTIFFGSIAVLHPIFP